jgi:hypothetical protein
MLRRIGARVVGVSEGDTIRSSRRATCNIRFACDGNRTLAELSARVLVDAQYTPSKVEGPDVSLEKDLLEVRDRVFIEVSRKSWTNNYGFDCTLPLNRL